MRSLLLLFSLLLPQPVLAQKAHELCGVCHSETLKDFLAHPHSQKGLSCDVCHGESLRHRNSEGHAEPDQVAASHEIPALCGNCHKGQGTASILKQYSDSQHGKLVLEKSKVRAPHCGTCHGVHGIRQGKSIEAQCKRCHTQLPASCSAPPPNSKATVSCVGCHSPHTLLASSSRPETRRSDEVKK